MRKAYFLLLILFLALISIIGCSNGSGNPVEPSGKESALDGITILNNDLRDIRINGESTSDLAFRYILSELESVPVSLDFVSDGEISASVDSGTIRTPDGQIRQSLKGNISQFDVIPGTDFGLVELNITLHSERDHSRKFWLAIGYEGNLPIPPYTDSIAVSPEGEEYEVAENEILIGLQPDATESQLRELLTALDMQIFQRFDDLKIYRVGISPEMGIYEAIGIIQGSYIIKYAEPNFIRRAMINPNDSAWAQKWDLRIMDGPEGWDIFTGDSNVIIGIIDSGVDRAHPDLAPKVLDGEDFVSPIGDGLGGAVPGDGIDNNGNNQVDENVFHGTHVAGIAAAKTNNGTGTAGVDWEASLMGLRIFPVNGDGGASSSSIMAAINYAKDTPNMKVINMSIGGPGSSNPEQTTINNAFNAGVVVVASAGNSGGTQLSFPASYDNVISVAATNSNDQKANFSQYNTRVDVSAPGVSIYSTSFPPNYAIASGTSMSAPEVSGLCGLIAGYYPAYGSQEIVDQVIYTTDNIDAQNPQYVGRIGTGRINIYRALTQPIKPDYQIISMMIDDDMLGVTDGNRDGLINPGEVIEVRLKVRNEGIKDGINPVGLLSIDDPFIHVLKSDISFPNIEKTKTQLSYEMFLITIDQNTPDGYEVSYLIDFDDDDNSGPHENPGTWTIYKDSKSLDMISLTGADLPPNGKIFKGIANQALMRVDVIGDVNYGTIDRLEILKFGSLDSSSVKEVRLYHDTDSDGMFDFDGTDLELGTSDYYNPGYFGNFDDLNDPNSGNPNGPINVPGDPVTFNNESKAIFNGLYLPATDDSSNSFFIVIDLNISATSGTTLQVGIVNESNIKLRIPDIINPDSLPILSQEFIVASTWETEQQITGGSSDHSWRPEGATNSAGEVFLVLDDDRGGDWDIYMKKSSTMGATFNPDKPLTFDSSNEFYPSIAIDSSDTLHVVYYTTLHGASNREIYYLRSTSGGTFWDDPVRLTNASGDSRVPDIAIGPDDAIHVVWYDERADTGIYYKQSLDGGDVWSADKKVANVSYYSSLGYPAPQVALGLDGVIHVIWEFQDVSIPFWNGTDVYYSKSVDNGANFSAQVNLTPGANGFDYASRLAATTDGNPFVVYHHYTGSSYEIHCRYSINGGNTFATKNLTPSGTSSSVRPDIHINKDNFIDVVYKDNFGGSFNVYHTFSETGIDGFNEPVQISGGAQVETLDGWPRVIRGPEKNIYAFWADQRTGVWEIFFNRYLY